MVLFRAVDIGAELFAMAACCSRAQMLVRKGDPNALDLPTSFAPRRGADCRSLQKLFGKKRRGSVQDGNEGLKGE